MTVALESSTATSAARPEVLRRAGVDHSRTIDLRTRASTGPGTGTVSPVVVVRDQPALAQHTRVMLGRDAESPLLWQRIAEAVLAAEPGDTVTVDATELPRMPRDLVEFLRYAGFRLARRGGVLRVEPGSHQIAALLRQAG